MIDHIDLLVSICETTQAEIESAKDATEHARQAITKSHATLSRAQETQRKARDIAACAQSLRESRQKKHKTDAQVSQGTMRT